MLEKGTGIHFVDSDSRAVSTRSLKWLLVLEGRLVGRLPPAQPPKGSDCSGECVVPPLNTDGALPKRFIPLISKSLKHNKTFLLNNSLQQNIQGITDKNAQNYHTANLKHISPDLLLKEKRGHHEECMQLKSCF